MAQARRTTEPHDRLTRMCDRLSEALKADPEYRGEGDQVVVFLTDEGRGGLVTINYDDDREAVADILFHLQAVMEANGKTLTIGALGDDGQVEKIA